MTVFSKLNQTKFQKAYTRLHRPWPKNEHRADELHTASFPTGRQTNTCYCAQFTLCNTCFSWRAWKPGNNKLKACQETRPTGKQDMDTGDSHHGHSILPRQTLFSRSSFASSECSQTWAKPPWKDQRLVKTCDIQCLSHSSPVPFLHLKNENL